MGQMKELFIAMRESYAESSRIQREMHERALNKEHQLTILKTKDVKPKNKKDESKQ